MCVLSEPPHQRYSPCIPALRVVESERQINIHSVLPAYPPSLPPHLWKMTPQPPQQTVVIHTAVVFIDIKQHSTISSFQPLHSLLFTCTFFTTYSSLSSPVLLLLFLLLLLIYYLIIIFLSSSSSYIIITRASVFSLMRSRQGIHPAVALCIFIKFM